MRAADAIASAIWAIDEDWLRLIMSIAMGDGEGPEAVAARLGRPLQNTQQVTMRDGVAVVPVIGPIFRYANLFTQVSGATSIEVLARDLRAAIEDPAVRAILLEVNSPGGQVDGINEMANMIFEARAAKPTIGYAGGMAASGGYWLLSAAGEVVIDETARLGSIGVVTRVTPDQNKDGSFDIVSSRSPNKRLDPTSEAGRAEILAQMDAVADVFIGAVARNRDVSTDTVLQSFGAGGLKVGRAAIAAGMADRAGSLETTLAQLAQGYEPKRRKTRMAADTEKTFTQKEVDELVAAASTAALAEGEKKGLEAGTAAERERILGIDKVAIPGHDALVAECKTNGTSVADTAIKLVEAEKVGRERHLEAIRREGDRRPPTPAASTTGDATKTGDDESLPLEERCKAAWAAEAKLRDEFVTYERYLGFRKAEAKGQVRILRRA